MKKVFLSALVAASLVFGTTSCSKDDETKDPVETKDDDKGDDTDGESPKTAKGTISFKFNGNDMSYSKLKLQDNPNDDKSYIVSATKTSGTTVYALNIVLKKGETGSEVLETFNFTAGTSPSDMYANLLGGITSDVTANSETEIKATFSGELKSGDNSKTGKFTEGVIDIKFE